jgi:hypothetical protein
MNCSMRLGQYGDLPDEGLENRYQARTTSGHGLLGAGTHKPAAAARRRCSSSVGLRRPL